MVEVLLRDGGNNVFPFIVPAPQIALLGALQPGDESRYHLGAAAHGAYRRHRCDRLRHASMRSKAPSISCSLTQNAMRR